MLANGGGAGGGIGVLGICGSPKMGGNVETFLREVLSAAAGVGATTEELLLGGLEVHDCRQCNFCVNRQQEGIFCSQQDDMAMVYPKLLLADAIVVASPTYLGRLSGITAAFLDRLRAFVFGNVYGGKLRNKVGAAAAVGWRRNAGIETTLLSIDYAFLALEMVVASVHKYGTFYGAGGFSSLGGTGEFIRGERRLVLHDEVGLKSAHALGRRVVELTQIIKTGQASS